VATGNLTRALTRSGEKAQGAAGVRCSQIHACRILLGAVGLLVGRVYDEGDGTHLAVLDAALEPGGRVQVLEEVDQKVMVRDDSDPACTDQNAMVGDRPEHNPACTSRASLFKCKPRRVFTRQMETNNGKHFLRQLRTLKTAA
jgi:hypothetical protein